MHVRDVMKHSFESIERQAAIRNAAAQMRDLDVGMLPVRENGAIVGSVTDRDITISATADGSDPNVTTVGDVMSDEVFTCSEEDDLAAAARIMETRQIRRLMVTNANGEFVGMLALADIAGRRETEGLTSEILNEVTQP
jgi:CBS domain-containing protein